MKLIKIEKELIPYLWSHVRSLLEKPVNRVSDECGLEDVYNCLINGINELWVLVDEENEIILSATTEFIRYPKQIVFQVILVGAKNNRLNDWVDYCWNDYSPLIYYAKQNGASKIQSNVRDGFVKVLDKYNFKKVSTLVVKEI
ncbi:MAG: hypothetical protein VW518_04005 [Burkholderiaceae bacterium]